MKSESSAGESPGSRSSATSSTTAKCSKRPTGPAASAQTIFKDGFGYDIGGHILFSKHDPINQLVERLLGDNCGNGQASEPDLFQEPVRQVSL